MEVTKMHAQAKITLKLQVLNDLQARELRLAWHEIVTGQQLARSEALEHGEAQVTARAMDALKIIEAAIRENPGTGQVERLIRFLAGLYNGGDFPFDLTDLRALDTKLANACLDYLNYDRLAKREVHHHLSGGEHELHAWMRTAGVGVEREETQPPELTR
jgi:hypothetical protein